MDPNLSMHHMCRAVRHWKERLVATDGVGTDIPPAVVTLAGPTVVGAYDLDIVKGLARDASVVAAIALSDCDRAVICYEAYIDPTGGGSPGDLAPRFATGDPDVEEAVVLNFVTRDGYSTSRTFPYTYAAGRKVRWKPPAVPLDVGQAQLSRQVQMMREGFARQADRGTPPVLNPGTQLHVVGEETTEHGALVSFAVTAPCPCGSQRPIEQCCAKWN
jgi:hypothetical protein